MRILGFSKMWPKLDQLRFTTFRFTRKDSDWAVGERVQVAYKPRSKERKVLGIAEIVSKETRRAREATVGTMPVLSFEEAVADGFEDWRTMWNWLLNTYGIRRLLLEPMNKLTLHWIEFKKI